MATSIDDKVLQIFSQTPLDDIDTIQASLSNSIATKDCQLKNLMQEHSSTLISCVTELDNILHTISNSHDLVTSLQDMLMSHESSFNMPESSELSLFNTSVLDEIESQIGSNDICLLLANFERLTRHQCEHDVIDDVVSSKSSLLMAECELLLENILYQNEHVLIKSIFGSNLTNFDSQLNQSITDIIKIGGMIFDINYTIDFLNSLFSKAISFSHLISLNNLFKFIFESFDVELLVCDCHKNLVKESLESIQSNIDYRQAIIHQSKLIELFDWKSEVSIIEQFFNQFTIGCLIDDSLFSTYFHQQIKYIDLELKLNSSLKFELLNFLEFFDNLNNLPRYFGETILNYSCSLVNKAYEEKFDEFGIFCFVENICGIFGFSDQNISKFSSQCVRSLVTSLNFQHYRPLQIGDSSKIFESSKVFSLPLSISSNLFTLFGGLFHMSVELFDYTSQNVKNVFGSNFFSTIYDLFASFLIDNQFDDVMVQKQVVFDLYFINILCELTQNDQDFIELTPKFSVISQVDVQQFYFPLMKSFLRSKFQYFSTLFNFKVSLNDYFATFEMESLDSFELSFL
ncbi:hypothetical protein P9112_003881 [Eukaryota sp. TZLM1-RC]